MRTGFGEHLLVGAVLFAVLALLLIPGGMDLLLAGAFFIVGAVMPDLDSPVSKPRKLMRRVVFVSALVLLLSSYPQLSAACGRFSDESSCTYLPVFAILAVFAAVYLLDLVIPKHRGFLHSFSAAVLYGAAVCLLMLYLGVGSPLRIGAWAFGGYLSHLLVDAVGDAIPFK